MRPKKLQTIQGGINVETFSTFYTALWNSHNYENKKKGRALNPLDEDEDMITLEELTETLQKTRNGKASGEDNLNSEMYKYASPEFKLKLLNFLMKYISQGKCDKNGEML
jgi:hypothetical protein